jgi:hypothetical protein
VTFFVLASVHSASTPPQPPYDSRTLWLESWDGSVVMPVPIDDLPHEMIGQRGILGLGVAPTDLATEGTPGVAGSRVVDVIERDRPVALPLSFIADRQADLWATIQRLRDLTNPMSGMTPDGNFRIVCTSSSGTRQIGLAYRSGLEGSDLEYYGTDAAVLDLLAPMPFAEDRTDLTREYSLGGGALNFFAWDDADMAAPNFEDLELAPDVILGEDMPLDITSAIPPYVTVEVVGPTGPGVVIEADTGLYLSVPDGIDAGDTLTIVTDPRRKSIRLDGVQAAGMIARGSRLNPLAFGQNLLSITAPGATSATRLRLSWRGMYRSLW